MTNSLKPFSLDGMIAIVTGGSRGIGKAIAFGLKDAGAEILILSRTKSPIFDNKPNMTHLACDVRNLSKFEKLVRGFLGGRELNILVNSAGISLPGDSIETFDETIEINLRAPFLISQAAVKLMGGRNSSIINITSLSAARGFPNNPGYIAAKGGLSQLTRSLAYDYGARGIRVNNIVPGYIKTEMTNASWHDSQLRKNRAKHTLLGRWGQPEDLVGAAIFLASPASSYVTGQDIVVDGGWLAKGLIES